MDAFRLRWNNYKDNDWKFQRNESSMQQHLYEHFYSEGHNGFLENVSVSLIDKTDGFQHKKSENYWMRTLKTLAPLRLKACVHYFLSNFYFSPNDRALQKLWNMFFISSKKLFPFSRYSGFCVSVFPSFFSVSAIALQVDPR